ncbi:MAG: SprT-like domain-containing protein [Bacteroidales bacterium]
MPTHNQILSDYLPEQSVPVIVQHLQEMNVLLKISRKRSSKLGDYRPPVHDPYHRISVNKDLNAFHFFLTLIHELAHVKTWIKYHNRVRPHGKEWKKEFTELMKPFLNEDIFPKTLLPHVVQYMTNPGASTSNSHLIKYLRSYDPPSDGSMLADLPERSYFSVPNGVVFQKLEKIRKRYKCKRLDNQRIYLVNSMLYVHRVEKN